MSEHVDTARVTRIGSGLLLATLLAVYLPGLGQGFIKDDFVWIGSNQAAGPADLVAPFRQAPDFYRPLVALSFAADWWLFGAEPLAYGLTNLAFLLAAAAALRSLAVALGMTPGAALAAAALWSLSFHGINMSLLWISGRTALLATLFALLAARAFVQGRTPRAAAWALAAMLAREDAVLLPFVLLAWAALPPPAGAGEPDGGRIARIDRIDPWQAARRAWPLFAVLAVYLAARAAAGGMTPWTAPAAYRFTLDPLTVGRNVLEYLDRAATLPLAATLIMALAAGTLPRPTARQWRQVTLGAVWMIGGYALAVVLPVRSSLYAVGPAAGAALAGAALLAAVRDRAAPGARRRMVGVAALLAVVAVPVHWTRNDRWVAWARLSTHVLDEVAPVAARLPPDRVVRLDDDRSVRTNLDAAFGTLIEEAVRVRTGLRRRVWIEPPVTGWQAGGLAAPDPEDVGARFALRGGVLVRVGPGP